MHYADPSGHWKLGQWLGKILGAIAGVVAGIATGNPIIGFQVYSAISSVYDTGYALAHGADPLRTIGAFVAANVLSAVMPGVPQGLQGDLFAQIAIGSARGAVIGGATAAIGGQDIGQGVLWGAGTGAIIGLASSQQFQNAIHGNGFVNNAQLAQKQLNGELQQLVNAQRENSFDALRKRSLLERTSIEAHSGIDIDAGTGQVDLYFFGNTKGEMGVHGGFTAAMSNYNMEGGMNLVKDRWFFRDAIAVSLDLIPFVNISVDPRTGDTTVDFSLITGGASITVEGQ